MDRPYIALPVHNTTIRSTWLRWEPSPGSAPAGVATCVLRLCILYGFGLGACSVLHPKSSFTLEYGCTPTCFFRICFVPDVFILMFSLHDIFCHMLRWSKSCASSTQVPMGARGTPPLHVHVWGEAHTLDLSEAAAHRDIGGSRDPYCWKHDANQTPLQDLPLLPGWACQHHVKHAWSQWTESQQYKCCVPGHGICQSSPMGPLPASDLE